MKKLKNLLGILITFSLLGLLSFIALVTLVDPTQFKDFIQNKMTLTTQYPVKLHGPLYWQFDPGFSLEAHDIEILSPKSSLTKDHLLVKKARIAPQFWSLFTGKLWFTLELVALDLHFTPNTRLEMVHLELDKLNGTWHYDKKANEIQVKHFNSQFTLPNLPVTTLTGNFNIEKINQEPMLQGTFLLSAKESGSITGTLKINAEPQFKNILTVTGALHGKKLQLGSIPITEIKTQVDYKEKLWHFNSLEAQIFNSFHQGKLQIDLQNHTPKFSLEDKIESADINQLIPPFENENPFQGKMVATTSLVSEGSNLSEILHALSGTTHVTLTDGKLKGIELYPLLQHVQATTSSLLDGIAAGNPVNIPVVVATELQQWKLQAEQPNKYATSFRTIDTQFIIQNKMLITKDFKLLHPNYTLDAHGTLDLGHQQAEYQVHAWLNRPLTHTSQVAEKFFKETPLSIQIHGPINNLTLFPDLSLYTNEAIKLIDKEHLPTSDKAVNPLEKLFGFP